MEALIEKPAENHAFLTWRKLFFPPSFLIFSLQSRRGYCKHVLHFKQSEKNGRTKNGKQRTNFHFLSFSDLSAPVCESHRAPDSHRRRKRDGLRALVSILGFDTPQRLVSIRPRGLLYPGLNPAPSEHSTQVAGLTAEGRQVQRTGRQPTSVLDLTKKSL